MIVIFKLTTGEEIIGRSDHTIGEPAVTIFDPMYVVDVRGEEYATTRLADCMLLSDADGLTFNGNHVIYYYAPTQKLEEYYTKAVLYSKNFTKPRINNQIAEAVDMIDDALREDDMANAMRRALSKISGPTSVH